MGGARVAGVSCMALAAPVEPPMEMTMRNQRRKRDRRRRVALRELHAVRANLKRGRRHERAAWRAVLFPVRLWVALRIARAGEWLLWVALQIAGERQRGR